MTRAIVDARGDIATVPDVFVSFVEVREPEVPVLS